MIPFVDLASQYAQIADRVEPEILGILRSGNYVGGPYVERFEKELASQLNCTNVVGVSNGTDAITVALEANMLRHELRPGYKVIVANNSFIATAYAVSRAGPTPLLLDVDPDTYMLTPETVREVLRKDKMIRAVIVTHLYGQQPDMKAFSDVTSESGQCTLIEDAAQSVGSTFDGRPVGYYSDCSTTSFYPTKNLGGIGQAGAVITNSDYMAKKIRHIINQGSTKKYKHEGLGGNYRMDPMVAAHLYHAAKKLPEWNANRRKIANIYNSAFGERAPKSNQGHIYHLYELRCKDKGERTKVEESLKEREVAYAFHYPQLISENFIYKGAETPVAEDLKNRLISLPMFPTMTDDQASEVVSAVLKCL